MRYLKIQDFELWVSFELRVGGQTDKQTDRQTHRHINTMTQPGLGAGPSEKVYIEPPVAQESMMCLC